MRRAAVVLSCLLAWVSTASAQDAEWYYSYTSSGPPSMCQEPSQCEKECESVGQADSTGASACRRLAQHYHDGTGVAPDRAKAAGLWKKSCDANNAWACMDYAYLVRDGYMIEVPQDRDAYEEYLGRAQAIMDYTCSAEMLAASVGEQKPWDLGVEDCYAKSQLLWKTQRGSTTDIEGFTDLISPANLACYYGLGEACVWLEGNLPTIMRDFIASMLVEMDLPDDELAQTEAELEAQFDEMMDQQFEQLSQQLNEVCTQYGDPVACARVGYQFLDKDNPSLARSAFSKACDTGHRDACFQMFIIDLEEMEDNGTTPEDDAFKDLIGKALKTCDGLGHAGCYDVIELYLEGSEIVPKNENKGFALIDSLCLAGHDVVCEYAAETYLDDQQHRDLAIRSLQRTCERSDPNATCQLCTVQSNHATCTVRRAWALQSACSEGEAERCEDIGRVYAQGVPGVPANADLAASYLRRGCAGNVKTSCVALDEMCHPADGKTTITDETMCQQSLIQSDLFYEAEWQFRATGSASVLGEKEGDAEAAVQAKVTGSAGVSASATVSLQRGSLDASLVMSIVLDRARQAAIRLVVDELMSAGRGRRVPGYLTDLLTQAAQLLGDQNTLRQEKFADLGMTVVRAFVASNLVNAVFGGAESILKHDLWATLAAEANVTWDPSGFKDKDLAVVQAYIVDWAYYLLGEIKLFGKAVGEAVSEPDCRFDKGPGKQMCDWLEGGRSRLKAALKVDLLVSGLGLVKALREEGSIDLRRFIEAANRSKVIANLHTTPGLSLDEWRTDIAARFREEVSAVGDQVGQLLWLINPETWKGSVNWDKSVRVANLVKGALTDKAHILARFNAEDIRSVLTVADMILKYSAEYAQVGFQMSQRKAIEAKLVADVSGHIKAWKGRAGFVGQIEGVARLVKKKVMPAIASVENTTLQLEAFMERFRPRVDDVIASMSAEASFSIADVPLSDLPELREHFQAAAKQLQALDDALGEVLPGVRRSVLRSAIGSVVRLLGFFDLMERVARTAQLDSRCGDIIEAIKTLGALREGSREFVAPVFDVMEPVLAAIQTHEPLDADMLFAIIDKVRLDSLITSLAAKIGGGKPCEKDDGGYECWTVKIVHALQEAVQRDGNTVVVDGGAFAQRLASHGDDFRRKHKWRSYFHLTVGFGGMFSFDPPSGDAMSDGSDRFVPLVSEQIGFGWASPSFWKDRLTFKTGIAASGLLYRAVLDSAESDAIMFSPFIAFDVYDLVELYAAPTVLVYPPIGDTDAGVRFGASFGLSVPLDAYLSEL